MEAISGGGEIEGKRRGAGNRDGAPRGFGEVGRRIDSGKLRRLKQAVKERSDLGPRWDFEP